MQTCVAKYIPLVDPLLEHSAQFRLTCPVEVEAKEEKKTALMIVLDVSGSMSSNGGLEFARPAIKKLLQSVEEGTTIHFIKFNDRCNEVENINTNPSSWVFLDRLQASGGTDFTALFITLAHKCERYVKEQFDSLTVFLFTDGQDYSDANQRASAQQELSKAMRSIHTTCVHTVGFTDNHNAALLNDLTQIGKSQGIFQFVQRQDDIAKALEVVSSQIQVASKSVRMELNGESFLAYLEPPMPGIIQYFNYSGSFLTRSKTLTESTLIMVDGNGTVPLRWIDYDTDDVISATIEALPTLLTKLSKESFSSNSNPVDKKQVIKQLDDLDSVIENTQEKVRAIRDKTVRSSYMESLEPIRNSIGEFYSLVTGNSKPTDKDIAKLNHNAYNLIQRRSTRKNLDQRFARNEIAADELAEEIKSLSESYVAKEKEWGQKFEEMASAFGSCIWSTKNWWECIRDSDCLGIALDISRDQNAIMDPSLVYVREIHPSLISADSFIECVKTVVKQRPNAHGGFDRRAKGEIVKGIARESITGMLPLYITPEHWKIARLKMRPVLGWMTTTDERGFSWGQMQIIPFKVLYKAALVKDSSQHREKQFLLILETCQQIIRDLDEKPPQPSPDWQPFSANIDARVNACPTDPASITVDVVPSIEAFMGQVLSRMNTLQLRCIPNQGEFMFSILEEDYRRGQPFAVKNYTQEELNKNIWTLLKLENIQSDFVYDCANDFRKSVEDLIAPRMDEIRKSLDDAVNKIMDGEPLVWEECVHSISHLVTINFDARQVSETMKPPLDSANHGLSPSDASAIAKRVRDTLASIGIPLWQIISGAVYTGFCDAFDEIGLLVQSIAHASNAKRRQAIQEGSYIRPSIANSGSIAKRFARDLISDKRINAIQSIINDANDALKQLLNSYERKIQRIQMDKNLYWEKKVHSHMAHWQKYPLLPLEHEDPICAECGCEKPNYAGFRVSNGCMKCYTSIYLRECDRNHYDVNVQ